MSGHPRREKFLPNIPLNPGFVSVNPFSLVLSLRSQDRLPHFPPGTQRVCPHQPSPEPLTDGGAHAVALGVDEPPDLGEVAVPLRHVLDAGGLHEQGVVGGQHALDALVVVLHQRRLLPAAHERPHLLVRRDLGFLPGTRGHTITPAPRLHLPNAPQPPSPSARTTFGVTGFACQQHFPLTGLNAEHSLAVSHFLCSARNFITGLDVKCSQVFWAHAGFFWSLLCVFLCLLSPETLFSMSAPYRPGNQRDLGFAPRVLHVTPLFLSPPQRGMPSMPWFALKNVGLRKNRSPRHSLALELSDLTNHVPRAAQPSVSLPRGVSAAAAARGADPSFPSRCSRHFSTAGDRTAPGKEAESGMLRQRCWECAVPCEECGAGGTAA